MSTKKSKNNPENRNINGKYVCPVCNEIKKPLRYVVSGKIDKMCFECNCGIRDKTGELIVSRKELEKVLD